MQPIQGLHRFHPLWWIITIKRVIDHSCSCHPNEILKIRSPELNATSGKQVFRTKDMHVIPAEILNGHNKIFIDTRTASISSPLMDYNRDILVFDCCFDIYYADILSSRKH
jgi:hypothetical protein